MNAGKTLKDRLEKHRNFWRREDANSFLTTVSIAKDFFFSTHYKAAEPLLQPRTVITPVMLEVDAFLADYERMYQDSLKVNQDGFWVAVPFTGIPWMEAMLGCRIIAMDSSFVSEPTGDTIDSIQDIAIDPDNPWLAKYLEFSKALTNLAAKRFPVGEPIMRGPSDMMGALLGQQAMVFAMMQDPVKSNVLLQQVTEAFLSVIRKQEVIVEDFHGGRSLGFYNVWTPGKCIWYQEDLSALLSPRLYKEMLRPCNELICSSHDYTAVHLHPSSFFIIDELLEIDNLKVIEVNKDIGGPSVQEMMPLLQKIAAKKNIILWGDLNAEDMEYIKKELPPTGVCLHVVARTVAHANRLLDIVS